MRIAQHHLSIATAPREIKEIARADLDTAEAQNNLSPSLPSNPFASSAYPLRPWC